MHRLIPALVALCLATGCTCRSAEPMPQATPPSTEAADAAPRLDVVSIVVVDHSDSDPPVDRLYIASSANAWDPRGTPAVERLASTDARPQAFRFEIPYRVASHPSFRFKFTRGDWDSVETEADGNYLQNRSLDGLLTGPADTVTFDLHAFADSIAQKPSTVVGTLHTFTLESEHLENTRTIRVWLPEGYEKGSDTYPVLYMHDGQNLFDQNTAAFGAEWEIDNTLTELIAAGEVPPIIVVGIDNAGAQRSWEYNTPELNFQGRPGRAHLHLRMLLKEIMPAIESRYRVRTGREHTAIGGSSFGGNATVYALMHAPKVFGAALIESPAIRSIGPDYERIILGYKGPWPDRVFIGMGTKETGDPARDAIYAEAATVLADHLKAHGVSEDNLTLVIDKGATHNEHAWAKRFPTAIKALFGD